jgi:hypothetical protein
MLITTDSSNAFVPLAAQQQTTTRASPSAIYSQISEQAFTLKTSLLTSIAKLRSFQERDGDFSIDFGVKGGELNETSRAPQRVNYYSISEDVGKAADEVLHTCDQLSKVSPTDEPTKYLGDKENGDKSPLNGAWKLLFTTAADASFSKNSTRGDAKAQNVVDSAKGKITNIIEFSSKNGTEPVLKQLNIVVKATAINSTRVELQFRYAKALLTKFFFIPLFGRTLPIYFPVPGPFITRIIVFFSRLFRFGRKSVKKVPKAYFDILYLDKDLRIHKTGEDNIFVQARESWDAAGPLLK